MISKPNATVDSNKERQQQHQDHDAATRIQSFLCRFIHQKQMIIEHTAAIIIQTHFWIFHQQHTLWDDNDNDKFFEEACHLEEVQHLNDLLLSLNSDFTAITDKFCHITQPTCDLHQDHNFIWPWHGPDPFFQLKQADLPVDCYVDTQVTSTNSYNEQQQSH